MTSGNDAARGASALAPHDDAPHRMSAGIPPGTGASVSAWISPPGSGGSASRARMPANCGESGSADPRSGPKARQFGCSGGAVQDEDGWLYWGTIHLQNNTAIRVEQKCNQPFCFGTPDSATR
jgi:hypothetical protein